VNSELSIRPLLEKDLAEADRIVRLAFGTFLDLPDPMAFMGDAAYVRPRWTADPTASFGAELGGALAGSSFATNWGSFGYFGPLTVRPDLWDRGIAKRLMEAMMECFARWETRHAGLFTFAQSPKHVGLYQKFGFWPRFLTAIMSKPVEGKREASAWSKFSDVPPNNQPEALNACAELTNTIYEGLDVGREIRAVSGQKLGETLLHWSGSILDGMAVCHHGAGTEAGSGRCYVKFAAIRPGRTAERVFESLLDACENMASAQGLSLLVAGVNMARHEAYRQMSAHGFRADYQGIAMQRPNEPGFNRPGVYVIDDWR
jgi:GNAT superfamily N-acetyltransferase